MARVYNYDIFNNIYYIVAYCEINTIQASFSAISFFEQRSQEKCKIYQLLIGYIID